jgi:hypothetical protein
LSSCPASAPAGGGLPAAAATGVVLYLMQDAELVIAGRESVKRHIISFILTCIFVSTACAEGKVFNNKDLERYQSRTLQSSLNVKSTKISVDFVDANLFQVIQMIAEVAKKKDGVTVFVSPEISGTITVKASNVPWNEVLKDIIEKHKLSALSLGKKTLLIYTKG